MRAGAMRACTKKIKRAAALGPSNNPPKHPKTPSNKFIHAEHIASNVTAVDEYARDRFPAVLAKLKERRMGEVVAKHCGYAPSMDL